MGQKVLIRWDSNWADEMSVSGFGISTQEVYDKWVSKVSEYTSFEFSIGSNEDMYYENGQDLVDEMTVTPISDDEELALRKFFPSGDFGITYGILYLNEDDWED